MPKVVQKKPTIRPPSIATLKKYGLTVVEWLAILLAQGNVCAICKKVPPSGIWVTDHDHVPKFKRMLPEHRKVYVRGILCSWCNSHFVHRSMTVEKAKNIATYLASYNKRKPTELHKPPKKLRKKIVKR